MTLSSLTFAYPHVGDADRAAILRRLRLAPSPADMFVLATCLRLEFSSSGSAEHLARRFEAIGGDRAMIARGELRSGEPAVEHLFRVAAGLESPIVGEREVLTQFRQALADQEGNGTVNGLLSKALEAAVATARQARAILPESPHDSMAAVAAQLAGACERVAVIGSGQMGTAVVAALRSLPAPPEILVVTRRPETVAGENVEVAGIDAVFEVLRRHSAVISATSAREYLVNSLHLTELLSERTEELLLIDMGMPPDFGNVGDKSIRYHGIDDLARMVRRRGYHEEVDELVATAARETHHRLSTHHEVGPVIGDLLKVADRVAGQVTDRFSGRLSSPDDRAVLAQAARTVARTILASPVQYLKSAERSDNAVEIIADAFEIDHA